MPNVSEKDLERWRKRDEDEARRAAVTDEVLGMFHPDMRSTARDVIAGSLHVQDGQVVNDAKAIATALLERSPLWGGKAAGAPADSRAATPAAQRTPPAARPRPTSVRAAVAEALTLQAAEAEKGGPQ